MEFEPKDLLTGKQLLELFNSICPNERAKIVCDKLTKYMFIDKEEHLCILQTNVTYERTKLNIHSLYTTVTDYIHKSFKHIDAETLTKLENIFEKKKDFKKYMNANLSTNAIVSKLTGYESQLLTYMTKLKVNFNEYSWQVHFNNGYIDLKTNILKQRVYGKDYVSYCVNRDYEVPSEEQKDEIYGFVNKIYPEKEDRDCMLSLISRCLIGRPDCDQDTLFLLGPGSSGKSFILTLTQNALEQYVETFQSEALEVGNKNRDKIFNSFVKKSWVLIMWLNEVSDKKMDASFFKKLCEGQVETCKLFKDGKYDLRLKCKLVATANIMPNIQVDTGTKRRFVAYPHSSKFTEDRSILDDSAHIYLLDKFVQDKIKERDLLNAWVCILAEMCKLNYENNAPPKTQKITEMIASVMDTNDFMQDFVDSALCLTNDSEDRIGKNEMCVEFSKRYPEKHLSLTQMISLLKEKKLQYESTFRVNNVKGCYTCVKFKTDFDDEKYEKELNKGVDTRDQSINVNQFIKAENQTLKDEMKKMKEKIRVMERNNRMEQNVLMCQALYKKTKARQIEVKEQSKLALKSINAYYESLAEKKVRIQPESKPLTHTVIKKVEIEEVEIPGYTNEMRKSLHASVGDFFKPAKKVVLPRPVIKNGLITIDFTD